MRHITKRPEPTCLSTWRAAGATFDDVDGPCKQDMRVHLAQEQGYLCCYCMERVEADDAHMKIEHWAPQHGPSGQPALALRWTNLLGACLGNQGAPPGRQHCDTRKRDQRITVSPLDQGCTSKIRYRATGEVDSDHAEIRKDLNEVLNLNAEHLRKAREATLAAFVKAMGKKHPGVWSKKQMDTELAELLRPASNGRLPPFVQVVVEFLRKRQARAA